MARVRTWWIVIAAAAVLALFAIVVGGFLWPRAQFEPGRAPWTIEPAPEESLPAATPDSAH